MKRFLISLLSMCVFSLHAQEATEKSYHHELTLGLHPEFNSFQDQKFSNIILSGLGAGISLDYSFYTKGIWRAELDAHLGKLSAKTHDYDDYTYKGFDIQLSYLHPFKDWETSSLYLGGAWSVLNYYNLLDGNLGNSAETFIAGSGINLAVEHLYITRNEKLLRSALRFHLFSFMKELPGFASPYPQGQAENGEFDYQDDGAIIPFALETYYLNPFWRFLKLETNFTYALNDRWSCSYHWLFFQSYEVKNQPLTVAQHSLGVQYTF